MKEHILEYFYNNHDNRSSVIAKHFNLKSYYVDKVIEEDLSKKANYMGDIKIKRKVPYRSTTQVEVFEDGVFIGRYNSFSECERQLNLPKSILTYKYRYLSKPKKFTVKHSKLNKTYTYKVYGKN